MCAVVCILCVCVCCVLSVFFVCVSSQVTSLYIALLIIQIVSK